MSGHPLPEDQQTITLYEDTGPLRCYVCQEIVESIEICGPLTPVHDSVTDRVLWMPAKTVQKPCGHEMPLPPKEPAQ